MKSIDKPNFNQHLKNRVNEVINEYNLIKDGEKIAVALSGGKDSVLTLHLLNERLKSGYNFEIFAIAINEGISGYRDEGMRIARMHADKLGLNLEERFIFDEFGFTLDHASDKFPTACIPCGVFRRYLLNKTAYEMGADKLATGHNLDDEVQSFLMSFARSDFRRFGKFGPKLHKIHPKMVPRIKPLWGIPEKDVGLWVVLNNIEVHMAECPYSHTSLRAKIKSYLNHVEENIPGTKMNFLKSFYKSFQKIEDSKGLITVKNCKICGEPSSTEICKVCELKKEIFN